MYLLVGVLNVNNKLMILMLQVMMIQKWKMMIEALGCFKNTTHISKYIVF